MNSALCVQDKSMCAQMYYFVGGTIFWEGRVHDLCVQRENICSVDSEDILISITFTLFYPPVLWVACIRNNGLSFKYLPFITGVCSWKETRITKAYLENELAEMSTNLAEQSKKGRHLLWRHTTVLFSSCYIEAKDLHLALYFTSIWQRKSVFSRNENK